LIVSLGPDVEALSFGIDNLVNQVRVGTQQLLTLMLMLLGLRSGERLKIN